VTRPVYEPTPSRWSSALDYGSQQLFRRPAPTGGCCPAWIAVFDDGYEGQPYDSADSGGFSDLFYPYIDWSDNSADIFTYEANSGAIFGKTYSYLPVIKVDGVYSFTLASWCEDLTATEFAMRWQLAFSGTAKYVGQQAGDKPLKAEEYFDFTNFSTSYFYFDRTWVLAFKVGASPPITVAPFVLGLRPSAGSDFTATLRNRLWITYHGPVEHASSFTTNNDPGPP